jgi:hypothetical protein
MISDEEADKGNGRRNDFTGAEACSQINSYVGLLHQESTLLLYAVLAAFVAVERVLDNRRT